MNIDLAGIALFALQGDFSRLHRKAHDSDIQMKPVPMQLDHIFLFVDSRRTAEQMMHRAGMRVNYGRSHPGQGTSNLCACLDDVFLELLWLDGSPVSVESKWVTLGERGRGNGLPIGISWRGVFPIKTVSYAAPFLPDGRSIPVAEASMDLSLPFLFESPAGTSPLERTDGLAGERQWPRYTSLKTCRIFLRDHERAARLLAGFETIEIEGGTENRIEFLLQGRAGHADKTIVWPF